ncbi:hypothetical protein L7F22_059975 [Adiantum nelumboides]|nr:hypothetical protein [Adiantum nelumboides]
MPVREDVVSVMEDPARERQGKGFASQRPSNMEPLSDEAIILAEINKENKEELLVLIRPPVHLGSENSCVLLGDCVACGMSIMQTIVTGVYMLRCQHPYHPLCFVTTCKCASQCLFHGCEEPLKDALKLLAPGEANMDEHVGTKKDPMEGIFGSHVDGIAHSQAGSSRKPNIDSMCGGCGDKNASLKKAGEDTSDQQKTKNRAEKRADVVEAQELSWIGDVQELDETIEDIAAKQDAKKDADVTLDKVEEDREPAVCSKIEEILPNCPGWGYLVLNFCKIKKLIILDLNGLFMKQNVSKCDPKTGQLGHPPRPTFDRVNIKRVNEKLWIYCNLFGI